MGHSLRIASTLIALRGDHMATMFRKSTMVGVNRPDFDGGSPVWFSGETGWSRGAHRDASWDREESAGRAVQESRSACATGSSQ